MRRAELHLRVGTALEGPAGRSGRALADLAYHFAAASPFGGTGRGVEYNVLAARAASATLAFDEAAARLRTALELGIDGLRERADVFLELGDSSHRGGKAIDALEAFSAAADIGRELADAHLLARAAIGHELGNTEIRAEAMAWRTPTFVALCDLESARSEVAALRETAEQTAQPFMLHVAEHYGSALALCDGRLEEAELRALRSHEWSRLLTGPDASGVYGIQMFSIRREQGRLAELAPVIRILAGEDRRGGPWRPGLVAVPPELRTEAQTRR